MTRSAPEPCKNMFFMFLQNLMLCFSCWDHFSALQTFANTTKTFENLAKSLLLFTFFSLFSFQISPRGCVCVRLVFTTIHPCVSRIFAHPENNFVSDKKDISLLSFLVSPCEVKKCHTIIHFARCAKTSHADNFIDTLFGTNCSRKVTGVIYYCSNPWGSLLTIIVTSVDDCDQV